MTTHPGFEAIGLIPVHAGKQMSPSWIMALEIIAPEKIHNAPFLAFG
jgi:hypothetical protein